MPSSIPKPPYDPDMALALAARTTPVDITLDYIPTMREGINTVSTVETALADEPFTHEERAVDGPDGPVTLAIFRPHPSGPSAPADPLLRPAIYHIHGGGLVGGNRFTVIKEPLRWARAADAILVSVEYRLAPEHPFPAPVEDCYAGLRWVGARLAELGVDPARLLLTGQSAGAALAAATAMMARDRGGPSLCAQMLDCPMLDDRLETNSSHQFVGEGIWSRGSSEMSWSAYLGSRKGAPDVSPYAAPARATDVSGLPPAFIGVGSAEVFRDEAVAYAQKLWAAGVQAELHVWPGGFHSFDLMLPTHPVSMLARDTRLAWVERMLTSAPEKP